MILKRKVTGGCFSVLLLLVLPLWFLLNKGAIQFWSLSALKGAGVSLTSSTNKGRLPRMLGQQHSPLWEGLRDLSRLPFSFSLSPSCKPWSAQDRKSLQVTLRQSLRHCQSASACSFKLQPFPGPLLCGMSHMPQQCISTSSTLIQPLHTSVPPSSLILSLFCSIAGSPRLAKVAIPAYQATLPLSLPPSPFPHHSSFSSISSFLSARPASWSRLLF